MRPGRIIVKTGKALLLAAVMGGLYTYAMFQGGFVSWFLFYSVLSAVILNALFIAYPLRRLQVTRNVSRTMLSYNESMEVTLHVEKKLPFPFLFLSVEDTVPSGVEGLGQESGTIFFLSPALSLSHSYDIRGGRRGEYWFSTVMLRTGDLFGFITKEYEVDLPQPVTVLPRLRPLKRWNGLRNENQETTPSAVRMMDQSYSVAGVRDYIPGDKMTSVDWKVSARAGKLVTKEFESQEGQGHLVIIDNTIEKSRDALEERIEFAASFTDYCYKKGVPTGLGFSTGEEVLLEEESKRAHFQSIYQELAKLEPGSASFDEAVFFRQQFHGRSLLYITSVMSAQRTEELQQVLKNRNELVVAFCGHETMDEQERIRLEKLRGSGAVTAYVWMDDNAFDITS
ncbi:DUF58 domain-containing protein [Salibacterium qingdaonense]|uniref:Uncharacterized conserved protein, DUF58 family, contains vWF domain n=1 Tax=Salibacterium qingdaonense TaxID=266892 RepID=A0A1I4NEV3_9BACI|nr:DUF58 domain-containing protein [Salibacterium qingdaonense]SFM13830.1 Uncharacterized conserved protein, DUF58 family, contains vWF domain [Salibacterium qingdaonense]